MLIKKIKAVVLKVSDLGESDKIVTFYSDQAGKIAGIAKGAKKSKKPLLPTKILIKIGFSKRIPFQEEKPFLMMTVTGEN